MGDEVYGLTVWPPGELKDFIARLQAEHGVSAYGAPHFNLRYPFRWRGPLESLLDRVAAEARAAQPFRAYVEGWHEFPNAVVISIRDTPEVRAAHEAMLAVGGEPLQRGRDRDDYFPHVTVALTEDADRKSSVARAGQSLELPRQWWVVGHVVATRDDAGHLTELGSFRLGS
ncbi:MAG TPA: 2'-5' RNA ligase family protein [Deinococcales bacterium]|nr:2'-5' RNA ligase family protein [Deinococcales bacterium]